ncbi:BspA family leucine-rich repeat surface protein [Mycoplasmopsis agalactiae]|uniref:BspA family leucine-rich repeat surface protein n=1 Tax=Mycoplasmopsis agalactiae TaxID=2110 RepID=UPI00211BF174|nr:BspA family leucine-rich repeat surface protein [Mycoplasmopsis agalactiae]UUM25854.1 BspA family leucine-rich repeat surface protein [Mycoplasmopsis agalactiae]
MSVLEISNIILNEIKEIEKKNNELNAKINSQQKNNNFYAAKLSKIEEHKDKLVKDEKRYKLAEAYRYKAKLKELPTKTNNKVHTEIENKLSNVSNLVSKSQLMSLQNLNNLLLEKQNILDELSYKTVKFDNEWELIREKLTSYWGYAVEPKYNENKTELKVIGWFVNKDFDIQIEQISQNVNKVPTLPGYINSLKNAFKDNLSDNIIGIENWDTKNVTDMSGVFWGAKNFNGNISKWDTSNVETMSSMFNDASKFDRNLSDWKTSNVTNMQSMFTDAKAFNNGSKSLNWDVSKVKDMKFMFFGAEKFNQDISNWNVKSVENHNHFSTNSGFANEENKLAPKFIN